LAFDGIGVGYKLESPAALLESWVKAGEAEMKYIGDDGRAEVSDKDRRRAWAESEVNEAMNDCHNRLWFELEARGWEVGRFAGGATDEERESVKALKQETEDNRAEALLAAKDLTAEEEAQLKSKERKGEKITEAERFQLRKAKVVWDLAVDGLTREDVDYYDGGQVMSKIHRVEQATDPKELLDYASLWDSGKDVSAQINPHARQRLYKAVWEALGVDLETGEGWITTAQARAAWSFCAGQAAVCEGLGVSMNGKDPMKWARQFLQGFGWKLGKWVWADQMFQPTIKNIGSGEISDQTQVSEKTPLNRQRAYPLVDAGFAQHRAVVERRRARRLAALHNNPSTPFDCSEAQAGYTYANDLQELACQRFGTFASHEAATLDRLTATWNSLGPDRRAALASLDPSGTAALTDDKERELAQWLYPVAA